VLFIIGTVAGIASKFVTNGLLGESSSLAEVAANAGRLQLGGLLVLVMGLALATIPAVLYPILRRENEALAMGYVIYRGGLEMFGYVLTVLSWLFLVAVAQQTQASAVGSAAASSSGLGSLFLGAQLPMTAITDIVFSIGGLMLYYVLYQAQLVPRWLSGWGIVGAVLYLSVGVIALFGPHLEALYVPLGLQEMVFAVWLIARGFNSVSVQAMPQPLAA
jgi:hypothetical protein